MLIFPRRHLLPVRFGTVGRNCFAVPAARALPFGFAIELHWPCRMVPGGAMAGAGLVAMVVAALANASPGASRLHGNGSRSHRLVICQGTCSDGRGAVSQGKPSGS
jgi:hypothetical protein